MTKTIDNNKISSALPNWREQNYIQQTNKTLRSFLSNNFNKLSFDQIPSDQLQQLKNVPKDRIIIDIQALESELIRDSYRELMTIACDCVSDHSDIVFRTLLDIHGISITYEDGVSGQVNNYLDSNLVMGVCQYELERCMSKVLDSSGNPSTDEEWIHATRTIHYTFKKVRETIMSLYSPDNQEDDDMYSMIKEFLLQNPEYESNLIDSLSDIEFVDESNESEVEYRIRQYVHDVVTDSEYEEDPVIFLMITTHHFKDVIEAQYSVISDNVIKQSSSSIGVETMNEAIRSFRVPQMNSPLNVNV